MENLNQTTSKSKFPPPDFIPPLENGDRLTREEFHRRYEAMPENVKAELIKGVVYMSSPTRVRNHGKPHIYFSIWLGNYHAATPGTEISDNSTLKIENDGEPQPDIAFWIHEDFGGNAFVSDEDYLEGAPELVVEIAASTVSYDLHDKKDVYEQIGVKEYLVGRVLDKAIDWFVLENGKYVALQPNADGIFESRVFPGLRLNAAAMLAGDLARVLADLQTGINSPEHAAFVRELESRRKI